VSASLPSWSRHMLVGCVAQKVGMPHYEYIDRTNFIKLEHKFIEVREIYESTILSIIVCTNTLSLFQ